MATARNNLQSALDGMIGDMISLVRREVDERQRHSQAMQQGDDAAASTSSENVSSLEQQFTALNQQQSQLRQRLRAINIFAAEE